MASLTTATLASLRRRLYYGLVLVGALIVVPALLSGWNIRMQQSRTVLEVRHRGIFYQSLTAHRRYDHLEIPVMDALEATAFWRDPSLDKEASATLKQHPNNHSNNNNDEWCFFIHGAMQCRDATELQRQGDLRLIEPLATHNDNNNNHQDAAADNLAFVWNFPATSFWIGLNVLAAALYWNYRVPVDAVAQVYGKEAWRLLSGGTAHFEITHLGLNMMSLSSLGASLEGSTLPSLTFACTNLSLLAYTGALWWMLQGRCNTASTTPTVGFSGVLFAWMVTVALDRPVSCLLPGSTHFCFRRWNIMGLFQINLGPLVQLVVLQLVLRRVSWTGHLAGVLVGFGLPVVPRWLVLPSVALPWMHLLWWQQQHYHHYHYLQSAWSMLLRWQQRRVEGCWLLATAVSYVTLTPGLAASLAAVGVWHIILISSSSSHSSSSSIGGSSTDSSCLSAARGLVVATVLTLVVDSLTWGSWWSYMAWLPTGAVLVLGLRLVGLLVFLVRIVVWYWHQDCDEETGIFRHLFYEPVLRPCLEVAGVVVVAAPSRSSNEWDSVGVGRRLGSGDDHPTNGLV